MSINTTINLNSAAKKRIIHATTLMEKPSSAIIVMLMKKVLKKHHQLLGDPRNVQYQERSNGKDWSCLHISIDYRDYEYFLDMRKFCKKSVSLIVTIAISLYLNELLLEFNKNVFTDNNLFKNYIVIKEIEENVICWKIYWGLPQKL